MNQSPLFILHVDDDTNDLTIVKAAFERAKLPAEIVTAADGDEAIDYLSGAGIYADRERFPLPSLVFLDLKMPRKNGFEVLTWVRAQPELRRLPVIIFTSSTHPKDMNRAYDCGANSYLIKPVMIEELIELAKAVVHYWGQLNQATRR